MILYAHTKFHLFLNLKYSQHAVSWIFF